MSDFEQLRHVDLCSGIGGFALGFQRAGLSYPVLFCDIEEWCRDVLDKHWPDVPKAVDVKELANDPIRNVPDCDILTAGYPCQPFSLAGQRKGQEDDRHIWPYILQIVAQKRPTWCVFENVYGHISLGLDQVLFDLEAESYAARAFVVPACSVDAPHRRDRVWIIARNVGDTDSQQRRATQKDRGLDLDGAVLDQRQGREETDAPERSGGDVAYAEGLHSNGSGEHPQQGQRQEPKLGDSSGSDNVAYAEGQHGHERLDGECKTASGSEGLQGEARTSGGNLAHADSTGLQGWEKTRNAGAKGSQRNQQFTRRSERADGENWLPEPNVGRVAHGVSRRVDRLKGLGNAIVPQIAEQIAITIKQVG